jgi:plastocyanin
MKKVYTIIFQVVACILFSAYAKATIVMIEVEDFEFNPEVVTVNVGDTIIRFWEEGFHTTTSTLIPSEATPWDAEISSSSPFFQYVVTFPGSYDYVCSPHASMGMVGHFTATGTTNIPVTTAASNLDFEWYVNGNDLIITTSFPKLTQEVKLLTLNGQVLKSFKQAALNQNNILSFDIGNVPKGIYLVEIASEKSRITRRVAIQ